MDLLLVSKCLNGINKRLIIGCLPRALPTSSTVCFKSQNYRRASSFKVCTHLPNNLLKSSQYNYADLFRPKLTPFTHSYDFSPSRGLHTSCACWDKSKVEDSLKVKQDEKAASAVTEEKVVVKPSLGTRIMAELKHYYNGFRLLFLDIKIASGTVWKYLNGKPVMRREHRQFTRAVSDIFRLAPFSVFIIIPLAEFALPLALKMFPNMLPSTFETSSIKETRLKKELAVKLEMSKFLQDAMEDIAVRAKKSVNKNAAAQDFYDFLEKIRDNKEQPSNEEIMKHAKFFETEVTLNNLSRDQLMALCKLLQIPAVGNNAALRLMLDLKLSSLYQDDKMIQEEGVKSLTTGELVTACQERGMRALGLSRARLEVQLQEWIDLHLNSKVSASLLLISRILYLPENVPMNYRLKEAISNLSENTAEEAKVRAAELNLERVDNTSRYKATKEEQTMIQNEKAAEQIAAAEVVVPAPSPTEVPSDEKKLEVVEPRKLNNITQDDIDVLVRAMVTATNNMTTLKEAKQELKDLQEDMDEYRSDVKTLKTQLAAEEDGLIKKDTKASKRIHTRLKRLVSRMDTIITDLETKEELGKDHNLKEKVVLSFDEMVSSMNKIENIPVEKLLAVFETLDTNKDGKIDISEARHIIKTLNSEDVEMTPQQLALVVALFGKKSDVTTKDQDLSKDKEASKDPAKDSTNDKEVIKDPAKDIS